MGLDVLETNTRARRFYLRHGYTDTGVRRPYANDPALSEIVMTRLLGCSIADSARA